MKYAYQNIKKTKKKTNELTKYLFYLLVAKFRNDTAYLDWFQTAHNISYVIHQSVELCNRAINILKQIKLIPL